MVPISKKLGSYKLVLLFTPFFPPSGRGRGWSYTKSGVLGAWPFLKHLALLWVWVEWREEAPRERSCLVILKPGFLKSKVVQKESDYLGQSDNRFEQSLAGWPAQRPGWAQAQDSAQRKHIAVTLAQFKETEISSWGDKGQTELTTLSLWFVLAELGASKLPGLKNRVVQSREPCVRKEEGLRRCSESLPSWPTKLSILPWSHGFPRSS